MSRRIAWAVGQEPSLLSAAVMRGGLEISSLAAVRVAENLAGRPEDLERLARLLQETDSTPDLRRALKGEVFSGVTTLRNLSDRDRPSSVIRALRHGILSGDGEMVDPSRMKRDNLPDHRLLRAALARHLSVWNEVFASAPPGDEAALLEGFREAEARLERETRPSFLLTQFLSPVAEDWARHTRNTACTTSLAAAGARLLARQARTGRLPSTLTSDACQGEVRLTVDETSFTLAVQGLPPLTWNPPKNP
ncbi:MAG: hypothetical protein MH204_11160 [Fimbriimonadaceae bacterium]|nr:hypothetical protein [Fimbriimonadaceae bacterium]